MLNNRNKLLKHYLSNGKLETNRDWLKMINNTLVESVRSSEEKF